MPKGHKGEKRPTDVIGNAVHVMRIAIGEEADDVIDDGKDHAAKALGAECGKKRTENMTPERRAEIAKKAAQKRWGKQQAWPPIFFDACF
ncbi:RNA-binding protein [Methylopila musalis]|uniref:RNA-binding protein n=1 Tax=Methylopila musalis TaxID=1134781 RepID=A0ABW3Z7V6_9HYPH